MRFIVLLLLLTGGYANAHQFTPTYPKLDQSYIPNVLKADMELFNSRMDVDFYELNVYDNDWNSVPFAVMEGKVVKVEYLKRKQIAVFIREADKDRAVYVCSVSKLVSDNTNKTSIASKICSKLK